MHQTQKKGPALREYDPKIHAFKIRPFLDRVDLLVSDAREELAARLGIHISGVYRLEMAEKGRHRRPIDQLRTVAKYLSEKLREEVSLEDLISE